MQPITGLLIAIALCAPALAWAKATPPQLNAGGFAACLGQAAPEFDLGQLQQRYRFRDTDLLLPFLAVNTTIRLPVLGLAQRAAKRRWTDSWNRRESTLAASLLGEEHLTPDVFFKKAAQTCSGDIFCAALISHNILRTLGRHSQAANAKHDYNPRWFKSNRDFWLAQIPLVRQALIPLRSDGGGDRWGEWYHFFGILTFAIHEVAHTGQLGTTLFVARMNAILNPWLTNGGIESAEKARIDLDSAQVAWLYLTRRLLASGSSCAETASYVRLMPLATLL
ncbi:MAG: hypothetical protein HY074_20130 [Deltaproteobacteria bacterium]|nr:hypothetical protein [Deltaproteobacteria bacterium]